MPRGSNKRKTIDDADAASVAQLPSDLLAVILLRLLASDLRRFSRVCKEWRDVISDLSFIGEHMVYGPRAPTHTIVFYPGRAQAGGVDEALSGGGFLFDEQWRLTARFAVNASSEMIGTCRGLLCLRDSVDGVIKVVEPFTGESIALALPPTANAKTCSTAAYCFCFDATARRYKIVHGAFEGKVKYDGYFFDPSCTRISIVKQELRVFTVGTDTDWRTVRIHGARHGVLYGDPACDVDGAVVCWYSIGYSDGFYRSVRFDLATESITSERRRLVRGVISCRYDSPVWLYPMHYIGIRWFGEFDLKDGCWSKHIDAVPHEIYDATQTGGRSLPGPHGLQRGHLLLMHREEDLRAHAIVKSGVDSLKISYCDSKTLMDIDACLEEEPAKKYRFFPVNRRRQESGEVDAPIIRRHPSQQPAISTFAYVPTVSPAPLALYVGTRTPRKDMHIL
jgi:hypothetical protein